MDVVINTDQNLLTPQASRNELKVEVEAKLAHFSSRLTRVELHLSAGSVGRSTGDGIRCLIEASWGQGSLVYFLA